ncbi:unnamed protein product [Soboliphyme baturini]|uniref:Peptidase A1 domain-containing protein n=1 Tax=Soboliphyme baturini TaxID=241478 RepID=A0A183J8W1_9BILA|nr:unnamed protein product [Soboliphyme baturini]
MCIPLVFRNLEGVFFHYTLLPHLKVNESDVYLKVGYTWLILKYLYDTNVTCGQDDRKLLLDSGADDKANSVVFVNPTSSFCGEASSALNNFILFTADNLVDDEVDYRSVGSGDVENIGKLPKDLQSVSKNGRYSAKLAPDLFDEAELCKIRFNQFDSHPK